MASQCIAGVVHFGKNSATPPPRIWTPGARWRGEKGGAGMGESAGAGEQFSVSVIADYINNHQTSGREDPLFIGN